MDTLIEAPFGKFDRPLFGSVDKPIKRLYA